MHQMRLQAESENKRGRVMDSRVRSESDANKKNPRKNFNFFSNQNAHHNTSCRR